MAQDENSRRLSRRRFIQGAAAAAAVPLTAGARGRDDDDDDDREHGRTACGDAPDVNLVNGRFIKDCSSGGRRIFQYRALRNRGLW